MKSKIIIAVFFLLSSYNVKSQESKSIEYKNIIIGQWNFLHTKSENDSIVNEDIRIKNIVFFMMAVLQ